MDRLKEDRNCPVGDAAVGDRVWGTMIDLTVRAKAAIGLSIIVFVSTLLVLISLIGIFRGAYVDALEARFGFSVAQSRTTIENGINLGFLLDDLSRLRGTHDLLEQEKARDEAIETIFVFDPTGRVVFSTDALQVGRSVSSRLLQQVADVDGLWMRDDGSGPVVGIPLVSSLDRPLGHVALRFDARLIESAVLTGWFAGAQIAAIILVPSLIVLVLLSWFVLGPVVRRLEAAETALSAMDEGRPDADPGPGAVTEAVAAFGERRSDLAAALQTEEKELTRLDEAA